MYMLPVIPVFQPGMPALKDTNGYMKHLSPVKIAAFYALFAGSWILLSDYALELIISDMKMIRQTQTIKGWVFVSITAFLLYVLIRGYAAEILSSREKLRINEQRYRNIFENSGACTVLIEPELIITLANSSFEKFSGYSGDEIQGKMNLLHFVIEEDRNSLRTYFKSYFETRIQTPDRISPEYQCRLVDRYGNIRNMLLKLDLVPDGSGAVASFVDITSLKKTQQRLRVSEQHFRAAFDSAPVGMGLLSPEGKYFKVNQALCDILGYTQKELSRTFWTDLTYPNDITISEKQIQELEVNAQTPLIEKRYVRKDGNIVWALVSAAAIRDPENHLYYYLIQILDITRRKKAMEEMEESEKRYRMLFDNAADPIIVYNFDGAVLDANQGACRHLGYSREEVLKLNIADICCPDEVSEFIEKLKGLGKSGRLVFETRCMHKNGHPIPVEVGMSEIEYAHKKAVLIIVRDIRERKQSEKLQLQLQQAQKMEAIGTLAGGIAHDFNNILFPIIGYTEMAMYDLPEGGRPRQQLEQVLEATTRAKDLVQQILTFSRKQEEELKPVKIQAIVKETLKLCRATFPSTIEIRKQIYPECGPVMGDPTRIHQIIMNLCTNAYQAMGDSGGILEIKLTETTLEEKDIIHRHVNLLPGPYVHLSVRDTGYGIKPDVLTKIFEPYFTTKAPGEGTGLGLAVTQSIVKNLNGDISVNSTLGEGTIFHVFLPLIQIEQTGLQIPQEKQLPEGNEHLLVIDDELQLLHMEQQMLSRLGYRISIYPGSLKALEIFRADPDNFDLIITDQTMPGMTGIELARTALQIRPDIPIILCSGYSHALEEDVIKRIGVRRYLLKPISMAELAVTIRETLDEKQEQKKGLRTEWEKLLSDSI